MPNYCNHFYLVLVLLLLTAQSVNTALAFAPPNKCTTRRTTTTIVLWAARSEGGDDRRNFLRSVVTATTVIASGGIPLPAAAEPKKRYVLDDETGEYVEMTEDGDWQKEWKSRYDQMTTMSRDEIFTAARGAGNIDSKDIVNESPASKKRRAFSGCRDKGIRSKLGNIDEKACTKRVLDGDVEYVLSVTDRELRAEAAASGVAKAAPSPVVDAVPRLDPPVGAVVSPSADIDAELVSAKQRIAEIEARIDRIKVLATPDR